MTTLGDKRVVLGAALLVLFGAWCLGVVYREPYPAPIFPRFGSIPEAEEIQPVRVRMLAFEAGDERRVVPAADAFDGAFDSFYPQMLDSLVDAERGDDDFARWVRERADVVLGWECADAFEVVEVVPDGSEADRSLKRFEFEACS